MVDPIRRRLAVDEVAAQLKQEVLGGKIRPGERFPSERDLAADFGVNRLTLRQAIARLIAQGLVTVRQGDGIRATDFRRFGTLDVLTDLFVAARGTSAVASLVRDLLELRRSAAGEVAALACARRTDADLARIAAEIDRLEGVASAEGAARRDVERAEVEVSRALVAAAGNLAFELLLNTIHRLSEAFPDASAAPRIPPDALVASYRALWELVRARDAEGARRATIASLEAFDAQVLAFVAASQRQGAGADARGGGGGREASR